MPNTVPWWAQSGGYFDQSYLDDPHYERDLQTVACQVDFIVDRLVLQESHRILDVACGPGRTLLELARRGYCVTGIDINNFFLNTARFGTKEEELFVKFVQGDMRHLPFSKGYFDVVLCVGSSIGYFEDEEENIKAIESMSSVVQSGGYLLLEFWADHGRSVEGTKEKPNIWSENKTDGIKVTMESWFDVEKRYAHIKITREKGGLILSSSEVDYRKFIPKEIERLLKLSGFTVQIFYLDYWNWEECSSEGVYRVVIIARKI